MEIFNLQSWVEFSEAISRIRAKYGTHTLPSLGEGDDVTCENQILFRGQANSEWSLRTTLERTVESRITIPQYLERAESCLQEIESVTGRKWDRPDEAEEDDNFRRRYFPKLPRYPYLVYLRHHGFPSPMLDWTASPYIAAYFAFESATDADRAAVFAYIESPEGGKPFGNDTAIHTLGPYVTTDRRHFSQKAWYTMATAWCDEHEVHSFCPHETVESSGIMSHDVLVKLTLPRTERVEALKQLDEFNLNHYTLFNSEDSLIRTLALRTFDFAFS